jgi:hypothetical protein
MFRRKPIFALLTATVFLGLAAQAFAESEKIECPPFTDKELLRTNYWSVFLAGKKIGYDTESVYKINCYGQPCVLYEDAEVLKGERFGKEITYTETSRMIVDGADFTPMYGEKAAKGASYESEVKVAASIVNERLIFKAHRVINGKATDKVVEGDLNQRVYFSDAVLDVYILAYMELRETDYLASFSLSSLRIMPREFTFKEKTFKNWRGEKTRVYIVESDYTTYWIDRHGEVLRETDNNSLIGVIKTTEQDYEKFNRVIKGYTLPNYVKDGVATLNALGVSTDVPQGGFCADRSKYGDTLLMYNLITDENVKIEGFVALPPNVDHKALLEHYRDIANNKPDGPQLVLGEGKMAVVNGGNCLTGEYTDINMGVEFKGRYYVIVEGGRGVVIMAEAPVPLWESGKDVLIKTAESIRLVEQSPAPKAETFTSKERGVVVTAPEKWWTFDTAESDAAYVFRLVNNWNSASASLRTEKWSEEENLKEMQFRLMQRLSEDPNVKIMDQITAKISGVDARGIIWSEQDPTGAPGKKYITTYILFVRNNTLYRLTTTCNEDQYESFKNDFKKIMDSFGFVE